MAYQVALADSAKADANRIYDWVVEQLPSEGLSGLRNSSTLYIPWNSFPIVARWLVKPGTCGEILVVSFLVSAAGFTGFFTKWMRSARPFGFSTSVTVHGGIWEPTNDRRCRVRAQPG